MTATDLAPPDTRAVPRVLPASALRSLSEHEAHYGPLPPTGKELIDEVARAGLRGRGGAGFPTATKLAAVAARRRPIVVVNATEGEPASRKDEVLCSVAPHLVLDGAVAAARAVGAKDIRICVDRMTPRAGEAMAAAVGERDGGRRDRVHMEVLATPDRYVAGEETALVQWINGGEAKPRFVPPRPFERGVNGRPTLVQNAETLAHLALIARHGAAWFRTAGTADDPGTALVTIAGAVARPGVSEIPNGAALESVLRHGGVEVGDVGGVLVGGYFGTWLSPPAAARTTWDRPSLKDAGAAPGCGVIAVVTRERCGLVEVARVARWLASRERRAVRTVRERPPGRRKRGRRAVSRRRTR